MGAFWIAIQLLSGGGGGLVHFSKAENAFRVDPVCLSEQTTARNGTFGVITSALLLFVNRRKGENRIKMASAEKVFLCATGDPLHRTWKL